MATYAVVPPQEIEGGMDDSSAHQGPITLEQCLELFTEPELLTKEEAWWVWLSGRGRSLPYIDSVVTTLTAVGQRSKHTQKYSQLCQRSVECLDTYARTTVCSLSLERFLVDSNQAASSRESLSYNIDDKNYRAVKSQCQKSAWSTTGQNFDLQSQL